MPSGETPAAPEPAPRRSRAAESRARDVREAWRVAAALVAAPALQQRLDLILEAAPRVGGADMATLYLRDPDAGALRAIARYGYPPGMFGTPRREGLTERVLATRREIVVQDTHAHDGVNPEVREAGVRSFVALPLLVPQHPPPPEPLELREPPPLPPLPAALPAGATPGPQGAPAPPAPPDEPQAIGVLYVNARRPAAFDAATVETLKGLAALAAVAIENAYLLEAQRTTAERLAAALRVRDQFVSVASHELKTPITPLKGYAQTIRRRLERAIAGGRPLESDWLRRALDVMLSQIDRLDRLVTDLLDVSRLRAGRFSIAAEPLDMVALAREIFERFRGSIEAGAETETATPGVTPTLSFRAGAASLPGSWDRNRLDQLLTNLLSNAVKYSPKGGLVELSVAPASSPEQPPDPGAEATTVYRLHAPDVGPGWVHLAVRDEGIGLPQGEAARAALFQAFTRGENAVAEQFTGLGLGLYICAEIVHRHGGAIWAESPGPGQGSTFHVLLPPHPPDSPDSPLSTPTTPTLPEPAGGSPA